jgi:hypothetical protein
LIAYGSGRRTRYCATTPRFPRGIHYELTNLRSNLRAPEAQTQCQDRYLAAATRIVVDALTEQLPRCLTPSAYTATVGQVQGLVDGLDAEMCLAWANEIAPDDVPSVETWARPERPE